MGKKVTSVWNVAITTLIKESLIVIYLDEDSQNQEVDPEVEVLLETTMEEVHIAMEEVEGIDGDLHLIPSQFPGHQRQRDAPIVEIEDLLVEVGVEADHLVLLQGEDKSEVTSVDTILHGVVEMKGDVKQAEVVVLVHVIRKYLRTAVFQI